MSSRNLQDVRVIYWRAISFWRWGYNALGIHHMPYYPHCTRPLKFGHQKLSKDQRLWMNTPVKTMEYGNPNVGTSQFFPSGLFGGGSGCTPGSFAFPGGPEGGELPCVLLGGHPGLRGGGGGQIVPHLCGRKLHAAVQSETSWPNEWLGATPAQPEAMTSTVANAWSAPSVPSASLGM